jgi:hypothetical protein
VIVQRAGRPVKVGAQVIIPLERMSLTASGKSGGLRGYAFLDPAGVAVLSRAGLEVLNERGERIPAEACLEKTRGLREAIISSLRPFSSPR